MTMAKGTFLPMMEHAQQEAIVECLLELTEYITKTAEEYGTAPSANDIINNFINPKIATFKKSKS